MLFRRALLVLLLCVSFATLAPESQAVGLGINKAKLEFTDVLRGGYAEESFIVSTDSPEPIQGIIEVEGDITDWLTFVPANATTEGFFFSADAPMRIVVIAQPPDDAANGDHEGIVRVLTGEVSRGGDGQYGTSARAAFKLASLVGITGVERRSCVVGGFSLGATEIGQPSDFRYSVRNTGNVRMRPDIEIVIYDQAREDLVRRLTVKTERDIRPTTSAVFLAQVATDLPIGQYWAAVSSPDCEGAADLTFDILERGGIADQGELVRLEVNPWAEVGDIVPIVGVFRNRGVRTVDAKLKGTITLGRKLVKVIDTDYYTTPADETARIETFFNPAEPGQYEIKGQVLYNNKLTYERTAYLNVNGTAVRKPKSLWVLLIIVVIIVLLLLIIRRKRSRRH